MKSLNELLLSVKVLSCTKGCRPFERQVEALTSDSRKVARGSVFFALKGSEQDGHEYVQDACGRGCLAVVVENDVQVSGNAACVRVEDSHLAYGQMAAAFYGHPAEAMTVLGLTGTNGKTTTSWIIEEMMKAAGKRPGVIGTVNYRYPGSAGKPVVHDASLTTPEPVYLQQLLRQMVDSGVTDVIIEVSSHALDQKRLAGMLFDVGVFTNLSRDHLDYHHTMSNYFTAKSKLFLDLLKEDGVAVVVVDQAEKRKDSLAIDWGRRLVGILQDEKFLQFQQVGGRRKNRAYITCGFDRTCSVSADLSLQDINGFNCHMTINNESLDFTSHLIGRHNGLNMLAAAGAGRAAGMQVEEIGQGLEKVSLVPGRLEKVGLSCCRAVAESPHIFVDYAHTPDALENALKTLRPLTANRLICIFGCGGNRDKGKRLLMGEVAGHLADVIMVTSDNPRKEDPSEIIREIEKGLKQVGVEKSRVDTLMRKISAGSIYGVHQDRREAVQIVCAGAKKGDVVLVAGKGHENYQISARGKRFFDDRLEVQNGLMRWNAARIVAATSGELIWAGEEDIYGEISTDSRTLQPGDVFVALHGENFDGHDHVTKAVEKGAAAVVVSRLPVGHEKTTTVVRVENTLTALGDLARFRRESRAPDVKVIAITGSSGKTTVKEMTAAILEAAVSAVPGQQVLKTRGNLNNLIGLPLSLLRLEAGHRFAVLEMGMNRSGEIKRMTEIAGPDIGCIINVQAAHLEGLGSIEGVARAKCELFDAMPAKGVRIINYDDPHVRKSGERYGNNVVGFGVTPGGRRFHPEIRATRIVNLGENGMRFTLHLNRWRKRFTIPSTGEHNVANCAAAAAIAIAAGIEPEYIVQGLTAYVSGDKRLQISTLPGGIKVVNDSYNANPSSMAAALQTVSKFGSECRRIAVLGDMLELGEGAVKAHRRVGCLVAELGFDFLAVTGDFAGDVIGAAWEAGMKKNRTIQCATTKDAACWINDLVKEKSVSRGDWLLLKGSRGMRMEEVLPHLERSTITYK